MNKRHKKKIGILVIIIAAAAFVVAAAVFYAFMQQAQKPATLTASEISLDQTPEYGACQLVTSNTIKETFYGDRITQLIEGVRVGQTAINDTIAEGCAYSFSTAKSNSNTLTASIYPYTVTSDGVDKETVALGWQEVSASRPMSYFGTGKENNGDTTVYMLRVIPGNQNVLFALRQPTNAATYDAPDALEFLVGIASKANLDVVTSNDKGNFPDPEGLPEEPNYGN